MRRSSRSLIGEALREELMHEISNVRKLYDSAAENFEQYLSKQQHRLLKRYNKQN